MKSFRYSCKIHVLFLVITLLALTNKSNAFAQPSCINSIGESYISNDDVASAKLEAISRAKWSAVEQVAGVDIKSKTIIEDSMLLDDVITAQMRGVVVAFTVLKEQRLDNNFTVNMNVCVEPSTAKTALSLVALNSSISVFIPAQSVNDSNHYEDENILSQAVSGKLSNQGYSVREIAESHALSITDIDSALKTKQIGVLRSLVYKNLTNTMLIGKVVPVKSVSKGADVGYGLSMPFNNVTARFTYQLLSRDTHDKILILTAGTEEAKGLAYLAEDAYAEALKELAVKFVPDILAKIHNHISEISHKIQVKVQGVKTPSEVFELRNIFQKIAWVTNVEDINMGDFRISYSESPIYLANSLSKNGFKIVTYNMDMIEITRLNQ